MERSARGHQHWRAGRPPSATRATSSSTRWRCPSLSPRRGARVRATTSAAYAHTPAIPSGLLHLAQVEAAGRLGAHRQRGPELATAAAACQFGRGQRRGHQGRADVRARRDRVAVGLARPRSPRRALASACAVTSLSHGSDDVMADLLVGRAGGWGGSPRAAASRPPLDLRTLLCI